jgi:hypothetical protein
MMMLLLLMMMTMLVLQGRRQALVTARGRGRPAGATRGPVQAGMRAADRGRRSGNEMGRRGKHVVVNTLWGGKHARRDAETEEAPEHARLDEAESGLVKRLREAIRCNQRLNALICAIIVQSGSSVSPSRGS